MVLSFRQVYIVAVKLEMVSFRQLEFRDLTSRHPFAHRPAENVRHHDLGINLHPLSFLLSHPSSFFCTP